MNTLIRTPRRDALQAMSTHDDADRFFRAFFGDGTPATAGAWAPALDVAEDEDAFTLHVDLPGLEADAVEVSLEENVLTISGDRAAPEGRDGFRRSERSFGRFHRAVRLPERVDGTQVTASHRNGVLTVVVPKAEEAKPRRIDVTAG